MRLTDDQLREVLARAEEIQRTSHSADAINAEMEAVIGAGEAVGLTRPAIERALRERLELSAEPPQPGSLAFAQSADGKYYVAEVLSVRDEGVRVRYLGGSEHTVNAEQALPCTFLPGDKVVVNWPWWGPWTGSVVSYDAAKLKVRVNDGWGYIKTFPISEVWINPRTPSNARGRVYAKMLAAGAVVGGVIGSIITALLLR